MEANPGSSISERSMECAQILLENLSSWPEHMQLVSALHRVGPNEAYDETKQLAASIEQSKAMYGWSKSPSKVQWKTRANTYNSGGQPRNCNYISETVENAQNLGLSVKQMTSKQKDLIGTRIVHQAKLLGGTTSALLDTGAMISSPGKEIEQRTQNGEIKAARRVYIPPHQFTLVPVRYDCIDNDVEVVLWPTKQGVTAGVLKVTHQETLLPVINVQNEPLLPKEGESVGRVGSER
ncbi:hypothetical protein OESDEN_12836 [Oesophagostomum dentatum]|uniref:Uncharacterized protein n=1 Tax=Oesophagostomum dentatum TaxID=61180 RepID=A0A0B1SV23_OESDE|nr:hypothetical protein OESDEN_12836 [Oesophagostomum dentatum]